VTNFKFHYLQQSIKPTVTQLSQLYQLPELSTTVIIIVFCLLLLVGLSCNLSFLRQVQLVYQVCEICVLPNDPIKRGTIYKLQSCVTRSKIYILNASKKQKNRADSVQKYKFLSELHHFAVANGASFFWVTRYIATLLFMFDQTN